jgi:hypothetical protein
MLDKNSTKKSGRRYAISNVSCIIGNLDKVVTLSVTFS